MPVCGQRSKYSPVVWLCLRELASSIMLSANAWIYGHSTALKTTCLWKYTAAGYIAEGGNDDLAISVTVHS
jgi:hypothetical protein